MISKNDDDVQNSFFAVAEANFRKASKSELPIFLTDAQRSTPLDATPYLVRYGIFRSTVHSWSGRERLSDRLDSVKIEVENLGFEILAILIGGSFTEFAKPQPNDIDCLLFYRLGENGNPATLAHIQRAAKAKGVDCRFVPLDGDPLALLKMTSYFSILYSKRKDRNEIVRCLILLDCR